jgi:uncharacterized protein (UPF0261 family)
VEIPEIVKPGFLIIATMDTKGPEALYLRDLLRGYGAEPLLMDISMRNVDPVAGTGETSAAHIAKAGGCTLEKLDRSRDMTANMKCMVAGAIQIARKLVANGKVSGVIGIGGCTGTLMITRILQTLPFGLPKIMVSTAAAQPGLSNQFLKTSDIMLFNSVIEVFGSSAPVRNILERAAYALKGMVESPVIAPVIDKERAVAITMMSPCERCARSVRMALEREGYQVIGFHANGIGDRAMETMIGTGQFRGVIDLAPGGVSEHLYRFMRDAGPVRLETAGRMGIPQVISLCGANHITPSRSMMKPKHRKRRKFDLDAFRTWIRMTPRELREVSLVFAGKLNRSVGTVKLLVPLQGWSAVDSPGSPTYDPEEDMIFIRELRSKLKKNIEIIEVDANMEDLEFSRAVIDKALYLFGKVIPRQQEEQR